MLVFFLLPKCVRFGQDAELPKMLSCWGGVHHNPGPDSMAPVSTASSWQRGPQDVLWSTPLNSPKHLLEIMM